MNSVTRNAWLMPALSLAAFTTVVFLGKRLPRKGAEIGIVATGIAAVLSLVVLVGDYVGGGGPLVDRAVSWFPFGLGRGLTLGMRVDGLTAVMFVVVTVVSLMVQIYSTAYMRGDRRYTWYFAALNLFTGSMLTLVIASNLIELLVGWELVGICSYLLIGHWWEEKANADAAIKAFITTKTGDVAFLIGIFVLFAAAGTFDIGGIIAHVEAGGISRLTLTAAAVLLFGGAMGKSAQFPLHVWLPDAMAGPTPVSALIHAATMVTAGVFLVARLFPVFEASPQALNEIALIGAFTMLMAALLAMVQDDIKRVLAYSTVSQLAYMMAALGVGAGNAAVFHLFTQAWTKSLLFLAAGSVIHAVHSNNMSEMGGLRRAMPVTYAAFLAGSLSLAGIPPLASFWSKDEILTAAYRAGTGASPAAPAVALVVFAVGMLTAFLTAFYMSRALHLTFSGDYRGDAHPHESPRAMTVPLLILTALTATAGLVGVPGWRSGFGAWVAVGGERHVPSASLPLIALSAGVALAGLALGRALYRPAPAVDPVTRLGWFHTLLARKFYFDDIYTKGIVETIRDRLATAVHRFDQQAIDGVVNGAAAAVRSAADAVHLVDRRVIDGAVNAVGIGTRRSSGFLKYIQSGNLQRYAAILFASVAVLAALFALVFARIR